MAQWINNDGLIVRLGSTEAEITRGGELASEGGTGRFWELSIDLANLASSSTILEDMQDVIFPSGLFIDEIAVENEIAATSGGSATLSLGLIRQDRTTTYDATAFLSAAPLANFDAVGETLVYRVGTTGAGTKLGVAIANAGDVHGGLALVANYGTAAFTAGRIRVVVKGHIPRPSPSNA